MKKLASLLIFFFSHLIHAQNGNVLYGERNLATTKSSLFLDKFGIIYPNYLISDSSLKENNASISTWYSENEDKFISISKDYNCTFAKYTIENCATLNDSIANTFSREINNQTNNFQSITFLIHGYRKSYISQNGDVSSVQGFQNIKDSITKIQPTNTKFIEIYWDAMYDCCFSPSPKKNKPLFQLFEQAQINAAFVGISLKKIISEIKIDEITVITHSLGAKVATYAFFNIDENKQKTPSNKQINLFIIAPAISGNMISDNYFKRNSVIDYKSRDNYKLIILYNENDFALRKKDDKFLLFGPGTYKYGNTSLGCNYKNSISKIENDFKINYPNSKIEIYDASTIGKKHHLENYCSSAEFKEIIKSLYH